MESHFGTVEFDAYKSGTSGEAFGRMLKVSKPDEAPGGRTGGRIFSASDGGPYESLNMGQSCQASVSVGFVAILGARAEAQSPSKSSSSMIVRGEVSQVEGEFHMAKDPQGLDTLDIVDKSYVITDRAGKELRLERRDTKVLNRVNPGDKIEAKISIEGHTLSVIRLKP